MSRRRISPWYYVTIVAMLVASMGVSAVPSMVVALLWGAVLVAATQFFFSVYLPDSVADIPTMLNPVGYFAGGANLWWAGSVHIAAVIVTAFIASDLGWTIDGSWYAKMAIFGIVLLAGKAYTNYRHSK